MSIFSWKIRFSLVAALVAGTSVLAQEGSQETPKLRIGIGGGFVSSPRPYMGATTRTFPIPVVQVDYGRWFVQGIRGGYRVSESEQWTVSAFAQARFQGLEPSDSPFLDGMKERSKSMDGGAEVLFRARPVGFRASALTDVLGRSNGQEFSAQAVTGAPLGAKLLVLAAFGPRWETARRVDYYYGVRPEEATSSRSQYTGGGTLNWDLTVSAFYRPSDRWSVFGLLNRSALGTAIRKSPTVDRDAVTSVVFFVTRRF